MRASELYKDDDFAAEREAIEKMERIAREHEAAKRRQERDRAAQDALVKRIEHLVWTRGLSWEQAGGMIADEDLRDHLLDHWWERQGMRQAAEEEREARVIGAMPWLASSGGKEVKAAPLAISQSSSKGDSPLLQSGRFTGLAAVIGGQPDSYGDVIQPGAFKASIAEARAKGKPFLFPLLYQHEPSRVIGGVASAEERPGGLYVECQLDLNTKDGKEAFSLIRGGYLDGMSIGYQTVMDGYKGNVRELREIRLLECSIVTFPANSGAQVSRVA